MLERTEPGRIIWRDDLRRFEKLLAEYRQLLETAKSDTKPSFEQFVQDREPKGENA